MLRKAGEATSVALRTVTLGDLFGGEAQSPQDTTFATIKVHRQAKQEKEAKIEDYSVPAERGGAVATTERRRAFH